jgi:hypothetical protein
MTKIYRTDSDGSQRFFADRFSALEFAKDENAQTGNEVEVEMITLIKAQPSMLAVALLEGGYSADAKIIKVYKRKEDR